MAVDALLPDLGAGGVASKAADCPSVGTSTCEPSHRSAAATLARGAEYRVGIGSRFRGRRRTAKSTTSEDGLRVLNKLNRGVLLIDLYRHVAFVNSSARAMLERTDRILVRRGRLEFASLPADGALKRFLNTDSTDTASRRSLVMRIKSRQPPADFRILVSAIEPLGSTRSFCVFIYEPRGGSKPLPTPVLRDLYELTAAESQLTNHLFTGKSLHESAALLGITVNTAKSALKRIFVKCEVRSQGELLQLLSLGPRTL